MMQSYLAKYSPGQNALMTHETFEAESDTHAFAIAVVMAPAGTVGLHVNRCNLEYIGGGAMPANADALINDIAQMAARYAPEGATEPVQQ